MGKQLLPQKKRTRNVAVVVFDAVDLLDVTLAFQVFQAAKDSAADKRPLHVFSVAERQRPLVTEAGLTISPRFSLENAPRVDVLIVPGGIGARTAAFNERLMGWLKQTAATVDLLASLSTGALLLGKAGALSGLQVTTHAQSCSLLKQVAKDAVVLPDERFVDAGKVVTGAGGTASMDACLLVVGKVLGAKRAEAAARSMGHSHWDPAWTDHLPE